MRRFVKGRAEQRGERATIKDGWFTGARKRAAAQDETFPTELTIHDLRPTAASLGISAGANVRAVQRMLGRASAAMTLDTYADPFDDDLDAVSAALDEARRAASEVKMKSRRALRPQVRCTGGTRSQRAPHDAAARRRGTPAGVGARPRAASRSSRCTRVRAILRTVRTLVPLEGLEPYNQALNEVTGTLEARDSGDSQ